MRSPSAGLLRLLPAVVLLALFLPVARADGTIFEHTTGYGGAPLLRNPQLMTKMKMTQGQLSYQKRLLVNQIQKLTGGGIT